MKAYKGFAADMTCRGFQYAEGETYEHDGDVVACRSGFHAVLSPLDVFGYYPPATSVYHVVELDGEHVANDGDSKVAARKLTVGASIGLKGLAEAHVEYVRANVKPDKKKTAHRSAASNTGDIVEVRAVEVDGKKVEPDTFYALVGGKVVKA